MDSSKVQVMTMMNPVTETANCQALASLPLTHRATMPINCECAQKLIEKRDGRTVTVAMTMADTLAHRP